MRLPSVILLPATFALLFLSACGPTEAQKLKSENEELQGRVDRLNEQLENVRSEASDLREKVDAAKSDSDDLTSRVSGFNDEDWRGVVGDVETGSQQVDSDIREVDTQLSSLESAAEEQ